MIPLVFIRLHSLKVFQVVKHLLVIFYLLVVIFFKEKVSWLETISHHGIAGSIVKQEADAG